MTTAQPPATGTPPARRRSLFNRSTLLSFIAGAALASALGASAYGVKACGHGMMMDGTHSAADVSAHVDHMLKHFYVEIDATDAQQAQIGPLVKQAVEDLLPMHAQLLAARARAVQALGQTAVDRGSLEAARVEHLQLADQASKRIAQLIADVGDKLTVPQRKALAERLEHMHGMSRS